MNELSLEEAYATEQAVLQTERTQLQRALKEAEASSAAARSALERDIEAGQSQLEQDREQLASLPGQPSWRPGGDLSSQRSGQRVSP